MNKRTSTSRAGVLGLCLSGLSVLATASAFADDCIAPEYPTSELLESGWILSPPLKAQEVERENLGPADRAGHLLPFGTMNDRWLELKATLQHTDTLHKATSSERGEMYVILRGNCVARAIRTVISN